MSEQRTATLLFNLFFFYNIASNWYIIFFYNIESNLEHRIQDKAYYIYPRLLVGGNVLSQLVCLSPFPFVASTFLESPFVESPFVVSPFVEYLFVEAPFVESPIVRFPFI